MAEEHQQFNTAASQPPAVQHQQNGGGKWREGGTQKGKRSAKQSVVIVIERLVALNAPTPSAPSALVLLRFNPPGPAAAWQAQRSKRRRLARPLPGIRIDY
ncbi:hypothetical protein ACRE_081880 [Hapsidospora chrysogenum ATCC 11550]|uniref:Uncharacterized protein n=1 Tax=Hapsidospora chrysogenum (strain ATCC 11550 / CBS 779.69 / DSM 880 / IAM 14645 / JCM 23072 / IMI 49137) TaxID=857340 RepID=A0A086SVI0_HAPC1|nr:hypothetical protein ACRE_081880 [Hapsidospora chrysogenum ATCC 11550]